VAAVRAVPSNRFDGHNARATADADLGAAGALLSGCEVRVVRVCLLAVLFLLTSCDRLTTETVGGAARAAAVAVEAPPQEPAPFLIQGRVSALADSFGDAVGIAVLDLQQNWLASHRGDQPFPQQSVSKLWVAVAVLDAVDRGELTLQTSLFIGPNELSVFNQPIAYRIGPEGGTFTVAELLLAQVADSDNAANDELLRAVGGPEAVRSLLLEKGLRGVTVSDYEGPFQARIAGLTWDPSWAGNSTFTWTRARMDGETRSAAMDAYVARPSDGASPEAVVTALARIERGEVLSPASTAALHHAMEVSRNGRKRLKGGLPAGWTLRHKTGTGQDFRGRSLGINDVGILIAPDGRKYAVAVMIGETRRPVPERLELFQAVSRAVVDQWAGDADGGGSAEIAAR
jgi:beta-lactamase class A